MTTQHTARESWLQEAVRLLDSWFTESGVTIPENIRVTVGFGPHGSRQESKRILGGTLHTKCSADGAVEIYVSPEAEDPLDMLATLVHELVHAVLLVQKELKWWAHTGPFAEMAGLIGLEGALRSSYPGPDLLEHLETIGQVLGPYPGARVTVSGRGPVDEEDDRQSTGPKPQTSRYLLAKCTENKDFDCYGYQVRMTRKWADWGMPACPMGHELVLEA